MQRTKAPLDIKRNGWKPPLPPRPPASVLERNAKRTSVRPRSTVYVRRSTSVIKTTVSTPQHHLKSDSLNGSCTNIANVTAREGKFSTLPRRKVKEDVITRQLQAQSTLSSKRPKTIYTVTDTTVDTQQLQLQAQSSLSSRQPRTIYTVADSTVDSKSTIMNMPAGRIINLRTEDDKGNISMNQNTSTNQLQQMSPSDGSRSKPLYSGAKVAQKSSYRPPRPPPIRPPPRTIPRVTKPNISPESKTKPDRPPPPVLRRVMVPVKRPPMPLPNEADQTGQYSYVDASVQRMLYPSKSGAGARADSLEGSDNQETQEITGFNIYSELDDVTREKDQSQGLCTCGYESLTKSTMEQDGDYTQLQDHDVTDTFSPDPSQSLCTCGYMYESLTKSTMEQVSLYTAPSYNTSH